MLTTNERAEAFAKSEKELGGFWSLGWERVLREIQTLDPTEEEKAHLAGLLAGYVERTMRGGHFTNFIGIEPLLEYLGIAQMEFTTELVGTILEIYEKFPMMFLLEMSPGLRDGRLYDGREYDRKEYVRELLIKGGYGPEFQTDEFIEKLWSVREILIKIHNERSFDRLFKSKEKITFTRLIESASRT